MTLEIAQNIDQLLESVISGSNGQVILASGDGHPPVVFCRDADGGFWIGDGLNTPIYLETTTAEGIYASVYDWVVDDIPISCP